MALEVVKTCPLGSKCEEIIDNRMHRCHLYLNIQGTDAQGKTHDKFDCSFNWPPIMLIEQSRTNMAQTGAIDSLRNEMIKRADLTNKLLSIPLVQMKEGEKLIGSDDVKQITGD